MLVILLEALAVLALFLFIIWWTMFSGRKKGELPGQQDEPRDDAGEADHPLVAMEPAHFGDPCKPARVLGVLIRRRLGHFSGCSSAA